MYDIVQAVCTRNNRTPGNDSKPADNPGRPAAAPVTLIDFGLLADRDAIFSRRKKSLLEP
jgi:hypothetical protein